MAVISESTVRPPLLARTFEAVPDLVLHLEGSTVVADDGVVSYYWGSGVDRDEVLDAIRADPEVAAVEAVTETAGRWLYRLRFPAGSQGADLYAAAVAYDMTGLELRMSAEGTTVRARFPDRDVMADIRDAMDGYDVEFTLHRIYPETAPDRADYGLTTKQREALLAAWHAGYYDVPRETDLEAIGEELGISHQSLAQRLRRGLDSLVESTLVRPECGPSGDDGSDRES